MADYDEIRSGRRRDWWKRRADERDRAAKRIAPLEEMSRLIQEAKQDKPSRRKRKRHARSAEDAPEDIGLAGPPADPRLLESDDRKKAADNPPPRPTHRSRFDRERAKDREEWEKTRRHLLFLGAIAGAALVVLLLVAVIWQSAHRDREAAELVKYMKRADKMETLNDLSTPARALATYRSAWLRGDFKLVWEITVTAMKRDTLAVRSEQQHLADLRRQHAAGADREWIDVIRGLQTPEYVQKPSRPYENGDLVAFRSQPYAPPGGKRAPGRYVISFVYVHGDWKFFKGVPESAWRASWKTIYEAKPGATIEGSWF